MNKVELIQHWNYFCSLAERLDETKHYVDHGIKKCKGEYCLVHGKVYSDIFRQILVLAASEFEVMSKALCLTKGIKVNGIVEISTTILNEFPKIRDFEVSTPFWTNIPLQEWDVIEGKVCGLDWWRNYNSQKHGGASSFKIANLENAIMALETLYIINVYLMYYLYGDMSIIYTYPTCYFKCKYLPYPISSGEGLIPDEGGLSPEEIIKQKYPDCFNKLKNE